MSDVVERSRKREVHLLYLRFFNILMSRKKLRGEDSKVCVCVCREEGVGVCVCV